MPDSMIEVLTTSIIATALFIVGLFLKKAQDFITKVIGGQTEEEKHIVYSYGKAQELLALNEKKHKLKAEYIHTVKQHVYRTVDKIISMQRGQAASTINRIWEERCNNFDHRDIIAEYKSAGESLRHELIKVYMTAVDINGFENKGPSEWNALVSDLFYTILHTSTDHYDTWYSAPEASAEIIQNDQSSIRNYILEAHSFLMAKIKALADELHTKTVQAEFDIKTTINDLSKGGKK